MYLKADHAEHSIGVLLDFIKQNPLGILTTAISSPTFPLIQSSHIPWVLDIHSDDPDAPVKGYLRGHMARQNPQSKAIIEALTTADSPSTSCLEQDVMVLFTGPYHHYVSPKFYRETKPNTGKVVPTWNYAAVQIYGKATVYHNSSSAESSAYLSKQIHDLSEHSETFIMGYNGREGRPEPWRVADAPGRYVEIKKKNIIGIEVTIESIGGKFKMSQDKNKGDRQGVIDGFESLHSETGTNMARMVKEQGEKKDTEKVKS